MMYISIYNKSIQFIIVFSLALFRFCVTKVKWTIYDKVANLGQRRKLLNL